MPEGELSADRPNVAPQSSRGALDGLIALLAGLEWAIRFPFDVVLAGLVNAGLCVETLCELLDLSRACLDDHIVRLGLRTPSDEPARRRGWTKEDERKALVWRAAGVHPEAIGANLSKTRSANAVRAKLRRMGQASPPRKQLFRPDAAFFEAFSFSAARHFGFGAGVSPGESCGRAAGPVTFRRSPPSSGIAAPSIGDSNPPIPGPHAAISKETASAPAPVVETVQPSEAAIASPPESARGNTRQTRRKTGALRPHSTDEGQRDFGFFSLGDGAEHAHTVPGRERTRDHAERTYADRACPVVRPIPATCDDVDFADLSWVAAVPLPLTHKPTVYAVGMLMMSGLHYRAAATLVGKTPASFRTMRTRMRIPVDRDRSKIVQEFDLEVARVTAERGGWIVAQSLRTAEQRGPNLFFWKEKSDRSTHLSPVLCRRDPMFSRKPPEMTIISRKMLDAEAWRARPHSQDHLSGSAQSELSEALYA
jgi:hypothetical protein